MRLHNIGYLLKEGGRNIFSNKLMSFACIGVLVACFLLIGSAILVTLTMNNVVEYVENQNEVWIFLEEKVTKADIDLIDMTLTNMDNISQVSFQSKEEALEREKLMAGDDGDIYDGLEADNPLPDSFIVHLSDLSLLDETVAEIRAISGVEKIRDVTDVVEVLVGLKTATNSAGAVVVAILVVVSIVIITNTIKLTVFSRRKEINIMKYVGATDSFIRMPFLVEGMLIGLIAAVFAFVILGVAYTYMLRWLGETFGAQPGFLVSVVLNSTVPFADVGFRIFLFFAAIGVFIGVMGSGAFVRKYLRV